MRKSLLVLVLLVLVLVLVLLLLLLLLLLHLVLLLLLLIVLVLHCPLREIPRNSAGAALSIPISVCSIFVCPTSLGNF